MRKRNLRTLQVLLREMLRWFQCCRSAKKRSRRKYRVLRTLQDGPYATCFTIRRTEDGAKFVGKVVKPKYRGSTNDLEILRLLAPHPSIVQFVEFVESEGLIVMEWCRGGDLAEFIANEAERLPGHTQAFLHRVFLPISDALEFLHTRYHVVHDDVKPGNILLVDGTRSKLCDFGLSYRLESPDARFEVNDSQGTVGYLAPEMLRFGTASFAVDVWAFGCTMFQCLFGKSPVELEDTGFEKYTLGWERTIMDRTLYFQFPEHVPWHQIPQSAWFKLAIRDCLLPERDRISLASLRRTLSSIPR